MLFYFIRFGRKAIYRWSIIWVICSFSKWCLILTEYFVKLSGYLICCFLQTFVSKLIVRKLTVIFQKFQFLRRSTDEVIIKVLTCPLGCCSNRVLWSFLGWYFFQIVYIFFKFNLHPLRRCFNILFLRTDDRL